MSAASDTTRRWVATLIVLLVVLRVGFWLWNTFRPTSESPDAIALQRKIAASKAYDDALLRAEAKLAQSDTAAAARLLDSLHRVPTDGLFPIERQKLAALQQHLGSVRHRPVSR